MSEHIPRDFIQQLLSRIEIVDLVDSRVSLKKKSGNNYFACCPFHSEKSASFSVSQHKQFYYCFGCGAGGNAIDFIMQMDHLSFPEAIEVLAKQAGIEVPREKGPYTQKRPSYENLYTLLTQASQYYQQALRESSRVIDYLKKRGITGQTAKTFELGFSPATWDHLLQAFGKQTESKEALLNAGMLIKKDDGGFYDRFRDRLMFPIHDQRGRIIGFGGRIIDQGEPKYLNSPETPIFQKGHELYGLYHALKTHRELKRVLIVEGYMDVIGLAEHGIHYAVATLGTATTSHHLTKLFRHTSEIIFCFDGDQAGRTAASRALHVTLPLMRDGIQIRFLFLPEGEDPDSLIQKEGKERFEERLSKADSLAHFFFQSIASQADLGTLDGRARFVKLATEHLNALPESLFQKMMFEELSKRARMDIHPSQKTTAIPLTLPKRRTPNTLRLAITLLVQYPYLANELSEPLPALELKGYTLFIELIEIAQQHPDLTTGKLLELWRDKPDSSIISKLAQTPLTLPEQGITHEFLGVIAQFKKLANQQLIEKLLAKASAGELTQEEKIQLNELIQSK